MGKGTKKWLIKLYDGRIKGPYSTSEVLSAISRGDFSGEETISLYPGGRWVPISQDPVFYDKLLEFLASDGAQVGFENLEKTASGVNEDVEPDAAVEEPPPEMAESSEPKVRQRRRGTAKKVTSAKDKTEGPSDSVKSNDVGDAEESDESDDDFDDDDVFELGKVDDIVRTKKAKRAILPIVVSAVAVCLALAYLLLSGSDSGQRTRLMAPREGQPAMNQNEVATLMVRASQAYTADTRSGYLQAQSFLVQAIEGDMRQSAAMALLCMTHLELWPFAYQDQADIKVVGRLVRLAGQADAGGLNHAACRVVQALVRGQILEAQTLSNLVLDSFAGSENPPTYFYYLRARILDVQREYASAARYAISAQQLWREWLRAYVLEAEMYEKQNQQERAATRFRQILDSNPGHVMSKIHLGAIEFKHFNHPEKAKELLKEALKVDRGAPNKSLSLAYQILAEIAVYENDGSRGLELAKKSYSLNSLNQESKALIEQLGGRVDDVKLKDQQLVFEGDQLLLAGEYSSAQALYKTAFELNNKNGMAAQKAAESLWRLGLSKDAISWLNKATLADPKLISAYVLLADYYAQQYNFEAAAKVLSKAKRISPRSYEVDRGYALVELRRNNPKGAIDWGTRAIKLYETDVETHVILARAYGMMGREPKAFENAYFHASQAIELDPSHREAQVVYAQALGDIQGIGTAISYLSKLVQAYPMVAEFSLGLAKVYSKDMQFDQARLVLEKLIQVADEPKAAYLELAKIYQAQEHFESARDAYLKAAVQDPADVEPLFYLGQLYLSINKPFDARTQFQRVKSLNSRYPLVNYYLGRAALLMNSPNEALEHAQLERRLNPKLADPYLLAAEAYTQLKQFNLCAREYQQAIKLRPVGAEIYVKVARCYRLSGNLDAATSMLDQAKARESGNAEIYKELGAVYLVRGDCSRANLAFEQYFVLDPNALDREQIEMKLLACGR